MTDWRNHIASDKEELLGKPTVKGTPACRLSSS